jgi:biotin operon repressor
MTRIATAHYRYKRPPREKAKAATLTGPAVVRAELPTAGTGKVKAKAAGELHPSDGKPAAVARAKHDAHDRRNRAIVKRLAAGASPRAVGAEFGLTAKRICQIHMQVTGARLRPPYASWPANHVARLRLLWRRGLSTAEIGRLLGVSKNAVVGKIDRLELPPPSGELQARKRRRSGRRPLWPANRITKLRKLWGILSKAAIARELGISKATVFRQARRLALPPRRPATSVPS